MNMQLTKRDSLYELLQAPRPARPATIPIEQYNVLSPSAREAYDAERILWLATDQQFATPGRNTLERVTGRVQRKNLGKFSGRYGVLLSGVSGMGKTTSLVALMRIELRKYADKNPRWEKEKRTPIVFVDVPAGASGKTMLGRFLHFLNYDNYDRWTLEKRTRVVVDTLTRAGTELVIVDEFHNLVDRAAGHQETANVLKGLSNDLTSVNFIYSGVNIHRSNVLRYETGQQISKRYMPAPMTGFQLTTAEDRKEWKRLIASFEAQLCLFNHKQGSLAAMHEFLYRRTGGAIGSLAFLILGAAQELVLDGDPEKEALTEEYLATFDIDLEAQRFEEGELDAVAA
jgi:hypothetical protein